MPVTLDAEVGRRKITHGITRCDVAHTGSQDFRLIDQPEELCRFPLGIHKPLDANVLVSFVMCSHGASHCDLISLRDRAVR